MAVVGGDDHDGLVPVAVGLDPVDDRPDGLVAAVDGADGVVEVVVVEGEIDVAGLDEEGEGRGLVGQDGQGGAGHVGQGRVLAEVGRGVGLGLASLPGAGSYLPSAVR